MNTLNKYLAILIIGFSACVNEPVDRSVIIKTGISFGECIGYCSLDVMITQNSVEYISSSRDEKKYPSKVKNLLISNNEWNQLTNAVNMDEFEKLDNVIGCPDCADGGSEWIEIILNQRRKKVTFEYGDSLKGVTKLLEEVRKIRNKYSNNLYVFNKSKKKELVDLNNIKLEGMGFNEHIKTNKITLAKD